VLAVALFWLWSGLPENLAYAGAVPQSGPTEIAQAVEKLEKLFKALEAAARDIPRETFDAKAVIEDVGRDPRKLFEWVRDETFLVPYRGALRWPKGVLMDRLGNSLDRALLLHEFFQLAGHQARLVHAALSEEQANDVRRRARPIPQGGGLAAPNGSRQATDDIVKKLEAYAQQYQLDQPELSKIIDKLTLEQQRMAEQAAQRVAEQTPVIAAAVGQPAAEDMAAVQTAALEALRDHWWVQWQQGSTWVDLDPSFAEAEPGRALTKAQETIQPDQLPNSLWHTVGVRLVVEFWERGQLREVPVLTQDLVPAQVFGERIVVRHVPVNWPKDLNLLEEQEPLQRLKATVLEQHEWLLVLSVGSTNYVKHAFTDAGAIIEHFGGGNPIAEPVAKNFIGLGEWVGALGGAQKQPEEAAHLTAEWIEYEIRAPGQPVRTIRRQIFDLLGPAARSIGKQPAFAITEAQRLERGLALLGESEILLLACQPSPEFVDHSTAEGLLANREVLLDVIQNAGSIPLNDLQGKMATLKPLPSQLYGLALARQEWNRFRGDVYLDRANILSYHKHPGLNSQGQLRMTEGVDIVANDVAVRPASGATPFLMRIEQGVLDTNAEAFVLAPTEITVLHENTAEIFAQSERQGIEWVIIHRGNQSAWQSVELPNDTRVRIERDLTEGYVVLVPKKAIFMEGRPVVGWWRVDPKTGQTLGINERGWGGDAAEKSILERVILGIARTFTAFDVCVIAVYTTGEYWPENMPITGWIKCASYGLAGGLAVAGNKILPWIAFALAAWATGTKVK
jgi:hypothetical protein